MSSKKVSLALGFVVLVIAGVIGGQLYSELHSDEFSAYVEKAEAYCFQSYGDASLLNAQVVGHHGGFHCAANRDDPHLHDVTDEALEAAFHANQSGETVDWSGVDRYGPRDQRGFFPDLKLFGSVIGVALAMSGGLRFVGRRRNWGDDEQ